jgi:hypothetical protein
LLNAGAGGGAGGEGIWLDDGSAGGVGGVGTNAFGGVNYPVLYFQAGADAGATYGVVVSDPEHGRITASAASGTLGDTITLSLEADAGYMLDYYTVNDRRLSGTSFVLAEDVTVSAVMRELKGLVLNFTAETDVYTLAVSKDGVVVDEGGVAVAVSGHAVLPGDTV